MDRVSLLQLSTCRGAWDEFASNIISVSEKIICKHVILWVKIIAECKEDVLLEPAAVLHSISTS